MKYMCESSMDYFFLSLFYIYNLNGCLRCARLAFEAGIVKNVSKVVKHEYKFHVQIEKLLSLVFGSDFQFLDIIIICQRLRMILNVQKGCLEK